VENGLREELELRVRRHSPQTSPPPAVEPKESGGLKKGGLWEYIEREASRDPGAEEDFVVKGMYQIKK